MKQAIKLKYSGDTLLSGNMNAYQVAGSILAFSDFIGAICQQLYGERAQLNTTIEGFQKGSFDIDFLLDIAGISATLLSTVPINFSEFIELMKESIGLFKHLGAKSPKFITREGDHVKIENNNGVINYFSINALNIINNKKTGDAVESYIKSPLENEGIDNVAIIPQNLEQIIIYKKDAPYFVPIDLSKPIEEYEANMALILVSPVFTDGNKWRFNDGNSTFYAEIIDSDFLQRVNSGKIRFGKGDTMKARVRIKQIGNFNSLKQERTILNIISHKEANTQNDLFL